MRAVDALALNPVIGTVCSLAEFPKALEHLDCEPFGDFVISVR
ncbi:hypothetical protein ACLEPN_08465 [Myxococcus sp. 1LA]